MAAALLVAACGVGTGGSAIHVGPGPYVHGSGTPVSQSRTLGPFTGVSAAEGVAVTLEPGEQSVTVTADDNLIGHVTTTVQGGVLGIDIDGSIETDTPIRVGVVAPGVVERLAASTGARIEAQGVDADTLAVEASTGGTVQAAGRSGKLHVGTQAGGTAQLRELAAKDAVVEIGTGSTAVVNATGSLSGAVTLGSTLRAVGGGTTTAVSVDGSSTLVRE